MGEVEAIFVLINKNISRTNRQQKRLPVTIVNCAKRASLTEVFKFVKILESLLLHLRAEGQNILRKNPRKKDHYSKLSLTLFKLRETLRE
jgi:hypothetical protein